MGLPTSEDRGVLSPAQELSLMKSQVSKLAGRLYTLEQDNELRSKRDFVLGVCAVVYFAVKILRNVFSQP